MFPPIQAHRSVKNPSFPPQPEKPPSNAVFPSLPFNVQSSTDIKIQELETENHQYRKIIESLRNQMKELEQNHHRINGRLEEENFQCHRTIVKLRNKVSQLEQKYGVIPFIRNKA